MGIENRLAQPPTTAPGHSLPLMGIENALPTAWYLHGARDSLPLMGIENPVDHDLQRPLGIVALITPHGD